MLELLGYTLLLGDEEWVVSVSSVVCLFKRGNFPMPSGLLPPCRTIELTLK